MDDDPGPRGCLRHAVLFYVVMPALILALTGACSLLERALLDREAPRERECYGVHCVTDAQPSLR